MTTAHERIHGSLQALADRRGQRATCTICGHIFEREAQFTRTTFTVTVLSQGPLPADINLADVAYEIGAGDCSGQTDRIDETLTGPQMAAALVGQGSDPEFLGLTADGEEAQS